MGDASTIRRNSLFSFLSAGTRILATTAMFIGIARLWGPLTLGQFALAHTILILFYIVGDFGIDLLLANEVARRRESTRELIARFLPLKLAASFLAIIGMCVVALGGNLSTDSRILIVILSVAILGNSLTTFVIALLKGHEQFFHETRSSFWQNLSLLLGLAVLWFAGSDVRAVAVLFVVSRFVGLVLILPAAQKNFGMFLTKISFYDWKETLRQAFPYTLHLFFGTLFFQLDTLLLAAMIGEGAVGQYQAAVKLVVFALAIPDILGGAVLPTLSRIFVEDRRKWVLLGQLLAKTLLYLGLPIGLLFLLYPGHLIELVFKDQGFVEAVPVLRIFALTVVIRFIGEAYGLLLTTSRQQAKRTGLGIAATMLNLGLNVIAIPRFGLEGAAIVALVTNVLVVGGNILFVGIRHQEFFSRIDMKQIGVIGMSVVFGGVLFYGRDLNPAVIALLFAVLVAMFVFVGYSQTERDLVFAVSRGRDA